MSSSGNSGRASDISNTRQPLGRLLDQKAGSSHWVSPPPARCATTAASSGRGEVEKGSGSKGEESACEEAARTRGQIDPRPHRSPLAMFKTKSHFDANKTKVNLKMLTNRFQLLIKKRANLAKQQKRQVATLLREKKEQNARILVEQIIREVSECARGTQRTRPSG